MAEHSDEGFHSDYGVNSNVAGNDIKRKTIMNDNTEHSCSGNTPEKCEILALLAKYHRNYNGIFKAKGRERLLDYLNNYSPLLGESHNIITKLYWLVHDIHDFPVCEVCGKSITGNIKHFDSGYCNPPCVHIYCSSKCA